MASSELALAAEHLARVASFYEDTKRLTLLASAEDTSPHAQVTEHLRKVKDLFLETQKARRGPRVMAIHARSHEQRMALEIEWEHVLRALSDGLVAQFDIEAAMRASQAAWITPPAEPADGVYVGASTHKMLNRLRKALSKPKPSDLSEVERWGMGRADTARGLLTDAPKDAEVVIMRGKNGEPLAVAAVTREGNKIHVHSFATAPGEGNGVRMMKEIAGVARKEGLGVSLDAAHGTEGFFQGLGMQVTGAQAAWSPRQAAVFSRSAGYLPPPGTSTAGSGLTPAEQSAVQQMALNFLQGVPGGKAATAEDVKRALTSVVNEQSWKTGAATQYLGLAAKTAEAAGQISLEHLGLNKTFAFANPTNMARDTFAVRGSKIIDNMYGAHRDALTKIITAATDPRNPKTIAEVKSAIKEQWPRLQAYQIERIARTETAAVWTQTAVNAYAANGISMFESIVATGPGVGISSAGACDFCVELAADAQLIEGDLPPWHPGCRCEAVPVLQDPETGDEWLPPDEPWTGGGIGSGPPLVQPKPLDPPISVQESAMLQEATRIDPATWDHAAYQDTLRPLVDSNVRITTRRDVQEGTLEWGGAQPEINGEAVANALGVQRIEQMTAEGDWRTIASTDPLPAPTPKPIPKPEPVPVPEPEPLPLDTSTADVPEGAFAPTQPLSEQELMAINDYTGKGGQGQDGYLVTNRYLRGQKKTHGAPLAMIQNRIANLDAAIAKSDPLAHEATVYRGIGNAEHYGTLKPGDVIEDPAYLSTSVTRTLPESWAGTHGDVWEIKLPAGTKGVDVNAALKGTAYGPHGLDFSTAKEQEIILARGQRLVVDSVKDRVTVYPNGNRVVAHDITAHVEPAPPAPAVIPMPKEIMPETWNETTFEGTLKPLEGEQVRITTKGYIEGAPATTTEGKLEWGSYGHPTIEGRTLGNGNNVVKIETRGSDGAWRTVIEDKTPRVEIPVKPSTENTLSPGMMNPLPKANVPELAVPKATDVVADPTALGSKEGGYAWLKNVHDRAEVGKQKVRITYHGKTFTGDLWISDSKLYADNFVIGNVVIREPELVTRIELKEGSRFTTIVESSRSNIGTGITGTRRIYPEPPPPAHVPRFKTIPEAHAWAMKNLTYDNFDIAGVKDLAGIQSAIDGMSGVLHPYEVRLGRVQFKSPGGKAKAAFYRAGDYMKLTGEESKTRFRGFLIRGQAKYTTPKTSQEAALAEHEIHVRKTGETIDRLEKGLARPDLAEGDRLNLEENLRVAKAMTRWAVDGESANPIRGIYAHEAAHALDAAYGLSRTFSDILKAKWGGEGSSEYRALSRLDRFSVSEYGASSYSELWAEAYAARELGIHIPQTVSDALDETLRRIDPAAIKAYEQKLKDALAAQERERTLADEFRRLHKRARLA